FSACGEKAPAAPSSEAQASAPAGEKEAEAPGNAQEYEITDNPDGIRTISGTFSHRQFDDPLQEAVVVTAESYLARGRYIQYDDSKLVKGTGAGTTYRWQKGVRAPEDYTEQNTGYTNCAAFCYDVYLNALDFDIKHWATSQLIAADYDELVFCYYPTGAESAETEKEVKESFLKELQPGDIIVRRYKDSESGHAMLYVGDNTYIHSTLPGGGSYNYTKKTEKAEVQGSICSWNISTLFDRSQKGYFFNCAAYGIVRPLNLFDGRIPDRTRMRVSDMQGVVASKISSVPVGHTVNPGDEVTYTVKLSNIEDTDKEIEVEDSLPEGLEYISGGERVGDGFYSKVTVPAGKTLSIAITARVAEDTPSGTVIKSAPAIAGGIELYAPDLYVRKTLTAEQQTAIDAAAGSFPDEEMTQLELLDYIYGQAGAEQVGGLSEPKIFGTLFDRYKTTNEYLSFDISSDLGKKVAPYLYGGWYVALDPEAFGGDRIRLLKSSCLIPGDLVVMSEDRAFNKTGFYVALSNGKLFDLAERKTLSEVESETLLEGALGCYAFAVIRPEGVAGGALSSGSKKTQSAGVPSYAATEAAKPRKTEYYEVTSNSYDIRNDPSTFSHKKYANALQEALIVTAEAYLSRGSFIQYDDTRLIKGSEAGANYRWQKATRSPEDYTEQSEGYTNCAAFTYDVYLNALDFDIKYWATYQLIDASEKELVFRYYPTGNEDAKTQNEIKDKFLKELVPGDIIVRRYNGNQNGHAMLYVGDGMYIHSRAPGGGNYDYEGKRERSEGSGSICYDSVNDFFDNKSSSAYFFSCVSYGIVRPLNIYTGGVPEKTRARVKNLQGIVARKISSVPVGNTVNPGDEVTYTVKLSNIEEKDIEVEIKDSMPRGVTYVSGGNLKDGAFTGKVKVPAGCTVSIPLTVRVKSDAQSGSVIESAAASAGGVPLKAPPLYVKKTLTESARKSIDDVSSAPTGGLSGSALLKQVYEKAGVKDAFPDAGEILASLYTPYNGSSSQYLSLNHASPYYKKLAPYLYGGYYVALDPDVYGGDRIRLLKPSCLMTGDLLVLSPDRSFEKAKAYIAVSGERLLDLSTGKITTRGVAADLLDGILGYHAFAVLRPEGGQ
ncbi:MAG: C40 family peptidase, partial [Clostridia bacterium]|nr:C40 family peptidase [Clostridia bacterium]